MEHTEYCDMLEINKNNLNNVRYNLTLKISINLEIKNTTELFEAKYVSIKNIAYLL